MTVEIQPITIWNAGTTEVATQFDLVTVFDNLESSATTYYQLLTKDNEQLSCGNQTIDGKDYQDWNNETDANGWLLNWSTTQLDITVK